jgi:ADP-heptose:LPS heptosyltransferase
MKAIENYLKNIFLKLLLILNSPKEKNTELLNQSGNKILFIRLNRIGDALVTTPLLHAVKNNLNAKIYLLADRKNYIAFNNNPDIDKLIIFNKGIKGFFEIRKLVKRENINTIVDLHDDVSTTVSFLIALAKAQSKFALEKENKNIYSRTIPRLDASKFHVVDRLLEIAKLFDIKIENADENIHFYPGEESFKKVDSFLNKIFSNKKYLVGINISAGNKARFWGTENYKKLIDFLTGFDVNLLLICSPEDLQDAKRISENKLTIFHSENYSEFAAMISKLNFLVTPDTAAVHLASAFQIPVFGIYVKYKTSEMIWSPYKSDFECVITEEPTLKNIRFKEVQNKLKPFIEKHIYKNSNVSR